MQMEQEREEEVEAAREEVLKQNAERFDKELLFLQNTKRAEVSEIWLLACATCCMSVCF